MMPKRTRFKYRVMPGGRRVVEPVDSVVHVDMSGTVAGILAEVGTDKRAAAYALEVERGAAKPRRTLIEKLEAL